MSHLGDASGAVVCDHDEREHDEHAHDDSVGDAGHRGARGYGDDHGHDHDHDHDGHGHSHGLVDRSILRSRDGVKTVSISLAVLTAAAAVQTVIFIASGSVAFLADLIHNYGDGLTAVPLGIAFFLRSARGERWAGLGVVLAILVSAMVALYEMIM